MRVNIVDYGDSGEGKFITYQVDGLLPDQIDYLQSNLDEDISVDGEILRIVMYFEEKLYPFQSDVAKIRMEDFIAREEIEMNIFLSSFLEDM